MVIFLFQVRRAHLYTHVLEDVDALVDPDTFEVFEVAGETSPRLWEFLREQIQ